MSKIDNILEGSKDLRKMPYSVPEGYFEGLDAKVRARIAEGEGSQAEPVGRKFTFPMRLVPYLSAAAVLAVVVALGLTLGLRGGKAVVPEDGLNDSDYVFYYTEIIPVTEPESIYYSYNSISDNELSYEEIAEYLMASGVDTETIINDLN